MDLKHLSLKTTTGRPLEVYIDTISKGMLDCITSTNKQTTKSFFHHIKKSPKFGHVNLYFIVAEVGVEG